MNLGDSGTEGFEDAEEPTAASRPPPDHVPSTTLGTGSALGIGCLIVVVILVLIAVAARWLAGSW